MMVEIRMQVSDHLAERIRPLKSYLPTVLELSLIGFQTVAAQTASELIEFLSTDPTPQQIFDYHVSERAQKRLRQLQALNDANLLGYSEQQELDELEKIEHICIMLKATIANANKLNGS